MTCEYLRYPITVKEQFTLNEGLFLSETTYSLKLTTIITKQIVAVIGFSERVWISEFPVPWFEFLPN